MIPQTHGGRHVLGSSRHAAPLPHAMVLDTWSRRAWTDGCQVDELTDLQALTVITRNSVYEIIVLSPRAGDVLVRGGRFFPDRRSARLAGATLGGSFLKLRGIYVGFRMELQVGRQAIVTSPVQSIVIGSPHEQVSH